MKTYYLVRNGQQEGPYSIEELANFSLSQSDLLWTEGMTEWKPLSDFSELQSVLFKTPPPIPNSFMNKPPSVKSEEVKAEASGASISNSPNDTIDKKESKTKVWWFVILGIVCLVGLFFLFTKLQTDATNARLEDEDERIEEESRKSAFEQRQREQRIKELTNELEILEYQLKENEQLINEANKFKLFRLRSEKAQELKILRDERNSLLSRILQVQSEIETLKGYVKESRLRYNRKYDEEIIDTLPVAIDVEAAEVVW